MNYDVRENEIRITIMILLRHYQNIAKSGSFMVNFRPSPDYADGSVVRKTLILLTSRFFGLISGRLCPFTL